MKAAIAVAQRALAVALRRLLTTDAGHDVLWTAKAAEETLAACRDAAPELLLLELGLGGGDAAALVRRILAERSVAILLLSAGARDVSRAFDALGAGALDVVAIPGIDADGELVGGAAVLGRVRMLQKLGSGSRPAVVPEVQAPQGATPLVAIGASTGGPAALAAILSKLPSDLAASLVMVQHIDDGFVEGLASWLTSSTGFRVAVARDGDALQPGTALVADAGRHLLVQPDRTVKYAAAPAGTLHCPSVDMLFESLLTQSSPGLAVLLTGMGQDGAQGLLKLRRAGWSTVCQDKRTCAVFGMPRAAIELGAAELVLGLEAVAPTIAGFAARAVRRG